MSNRGKEWNSFAVKVLSHIDSYTVPQYGDFPNDQIAKEFNLHDMAVCIKRYCNRIETSQRGIEDSLRDCKKIAHYACMIHSKLLEEKG